MLLLLAEIHALVVDVVGRDLAVVVVGQDLAVVVGQDLAVVVDAVGRDSCCC